MKCSWKFDLIAKKKKKKENKTNWTLHQEIYTHQMTKLSYEKKKFPVISQWEKNQEFMKRSMFFDKLNRIRMKIDTNTFKCMRRFLKRHNTVATIEATDIYSKFLNIFLFYLKYKSELKTIQQNIKLEKKKKINRIVYVKQTFFAFLCFRLKISKRHTT